MTRHKRKICLFVVALLLIPALTNAQGIEEYKVAEIFPSTLFEADPDGIIDFNGKAAFHDKGTLWITDGTMNGTTKISFPEWESIELAEYPRTSNSVTFNNELYFVVHINRKRNIWATDGTIEGTREVVNIDNAGYYEFRDIKVFGNRIAFTAHVQGEGDQVFLINESGVGAQRVNGISKIYMVGVGPRMAVIGDNLYIPEAKGGTVQLTKIDQQGNTSDAWAMPKNGDDLPSIHTLVQADTRFFFSGNDGTGIAAWMFDGTTPTQLFNPDETAKENRALANLTAVGDNVYFFSYPWDPTLKDNKGDFYHLVQLYFSDGTKSGTTRLWSSELGLGYGIQDVANFPAGAASNRFVFLAPQSAVYSLSFMGVGTSSASFEPIMIGSEPVKKKTNHPELIPVHNGAWIDARNDIVFTDGTTNGTFALPRKGILHVNHLSIINDRPWFTARTSYTGRMSIWRGLPISEWAPSRPMLLEPTDKNRYVSENPTFLWEKSINAEHYQLQVSKQNDFTDLVFDDATIVDTTFTYTDSLAFSTSYYWRVRAQNADSTGDWSSTFEFKTAIERPSTPVLSSPLNEAKNTEVDKPLYWTSSARATSYNVQVSESIEFNTTYIDTVVNSYRLMSHPPFAENTTYYWRAKAINSGGDSEWSSIWNFSTSTAVSTENKNIPVEFTLQQNYPNPFNPTTQIRFGIKDAVDVKLTVYNMLGQEVATLVNEKKSAGWHTVTFDASGFSSGFYIYRIQAGNFVNAKKLMLIK